MGKDLLGNPYKQTNPTLSLGSTLSISTPAPIIGTTGITYQPGKFTTLTNPDLGNPYRNRKPDLSLKKPSELKLDRPKSTPAEDESSVTKKKTIYIVVGVAALIGVIILLNRNNENK
jgi:hypothetical protein